MEIFKESVVQKEKFRIASNKLLNNCFLLKKKDNTKDDYVFVQQNKELFIQYFELLGYKLIMNLEQGVIGLVNEFGTGRLSLSKYESILLLICRLLYIEKRKEIGTSSDDVVVLMDEIHDKYNMLKIKAKPVMDKKMVREGIALLRRYHLVQNLDGDVTDYDCRILIYPSINMAITPDNINELHKNIEDKLSQYAGGETVDGDTDKETDEKTD